MKEDTETRLVLAFEIYKLLFPLLIYFITLSLKLWLVKRKVQPEKSKPTVDIFVNIYFIIEWRRQDCMLFYSFINTITDKRFYHAISFCHTIPSPKLWWKYP